VEAINDYDICVSFEEANKNKQYIKGIYINESDKGFLKETNKGFCLNFSDALNCFIGGRGTGKSTVLEMIEYTLSQRCKSVESLDFLCNHGNAFILYEYLGKEYLVKFFMPEKGEHKNILQCFGQNIEDRDRYFYRYNKEDIRLYSFQHYLEVYDVIHKDIICFEKIDNKRDVMKSLFDMRYSVNELVNTASSDEITCFLFSILFENKTLAKPESVINIRSVSGLSKMLSNVKSVLEKRAVDVASIIEPFNENQSGILRIVYTQDHVPHDPKFELWLWSGRFWDDDFFKIGKSKYNVTYDSIGQYLLAVYADFGIFEFIDMILKRNVMQAMNSKNFLEFCEPMAQSLIDDGIIEIESNISHTILNDIFSKLITNGNIRYVLDYLKTYVNEIESFSLEFNIHNRESTQNMKPQYRDVRHLSLGQKVVAMLSFLLSYSDFSNDYRPLIIDQPEDNLDNQYIHKNLIKQLRDAKGKRQVIIATHNATLVTNAKAEQVCVMTSDGEHGWIEARGYATENAIKKHIINYLEGGPDSFNHKFLVYEDVLKQSF